MASEGKGDDAFKMPYVPLGKSGVRVSTLCLGCMTFGAPDKDPDAPEGKLQTDEETSHAMLDAFVAAGGNFIDTADVYGGGKSEQVVGRWLVKQDRKRIFLATKARFPMDPTDPNAVGLSRKHLFDAVDASLARLQTTYIDLFTLHCWDDGTPLDETLRALKTLLDMGKIMYVSLSNFTGWQIQKFVDGCDRVGMPRPIAAQVQYSLLCRETEFEVTDVCEREGLGVLPWSPLKGGWLSGKYKRDMSDAPAGTRQALADKTGRFLQSSPGFKAFATDRVFDLLDVMQEVATAHVDAGATVAQVALRWLLQKSSVSSIVIGARTMPHFTDNVGAAGGWKLTPEEMAKLDKASAVPIPYPYEMVWRCQSGRT